MIGVSGSFGSALTGKPYAGATITIKDASSGATYWTGTTNASGLFSGSFAASAAVACAITAANGTWTNPGTCGYTVTIPTTTKNQTLNCGANTVTITTTLNPNTFALPTCGGNTPQTASVSITGPVSFSCAHFANTGSMYLPPGTYSYTVTCDRWATKTGTFAVSSTATTTNQNVSPTYTPASGYVCASCSFVSYPVATTLHGSFSGGGSFTFLATGSATFSATFPGATPDCCNLPAPVTVAATFALCGPFTFESTAIGSQCPASGGGTMAQMPVSIASVSLTPPFSATYSAQALGTRFDGTTCYYAGTFTITE